MNNIVNSQTINCKININESVDSNGVESKHPTISCVIGRPDITQNVLLDEKKFLKSKKKSKKCTGKSTGYVKKRKRFKSKKNNKDSWLNDNENATVYSIKHCLEKKSNFINVLEEYQEIDNQITTCIDLLKSSDPNDHLKFLSSMYIYIYIILFL